MTRGCLLIALQVAATPVMAADSTQVKATPPKATKISYYYDAVDQNLVRPIARFFDPALGARKATGKKREAANVDENDQVRLPSTWWQPRLGFREVTPEQMKIGPGPGTGPLRDEKWKVTGLKTQGVSLGIRIKDSAGETFQLKFDPPRWPEMASGADVVASHLFWAAGYNVPDNSIVNFTRADLEIGEGATYTDMLGKKKEITWERIDQILSRVPRAPDSSYRAVASRFIKGKPLGEWEFTGRRKDDPEDLIPHQLRREIRGLYSVSAWINNTDGSARNTIDFWVTDGGRSFVRHYLLDFSGCLGSASIDRQSYANGLEHLVDFGTTAYNFVTLGLVPFAWEKTKDPHLTAVGFFEATAFNPRNWKPFLGNPAWDDRTDRDMRWGARIVSGFTDEHIREAVKLGRYSNPGAEDYIVRTLIARRDKLVRELLGETPQVQSAR
ncbi:MAG TPA: hypothetical protein VFQ05_01330 [Candidatus Eisenbacteria bacterium]|nr:hypothetical protein [Candidatus Eisenbacteria bacterium]